MIILIIIKMFIVIKTQNDNQKILKIHLENLDVLQKWVDDYIETQIESYTMCPQIQNTKYMSFKITKNEDLSEIILTKYYKKIYPGYVYNSSEWTTENILKLQIVECEDSLLIDESEKSKKSDFWFKYNNEINSSVLKQLDRESMYNVFSHLTELVNQKPKSFQEEYINMLSSSLRLIKKELYNITIKRIKRMGHLMENAKDD